METLIASVLAVTGLVEIYILVYLLAAPRAGRHTVSRQRLEKLNVFLLLFFAMSLGAFMFLNGPAYAESIVYDLRAFFGGDTYRITDNPIFNLPSAAASSTPVDGYAGPNVTVLPQGTRMELVIPKTGVRTPIIFPEDPSTKGVLRALESGVGVYPGSVMPGQKGHTIILGHSSLASWYRGDYGRVFALLNRLAVGDQFMIVAGDVKYVYEITANQVFKPAAADAYMALPTQDSVTDLVTCDPVGSAANRRIVSARLIAGGR